MTKTYMTTKKAGDLMLGDKLLGWAMPKTEDMTTWQKSRRVLDYKRATSSRAGMLQVSLDDGSKIMLWPEMIVLVEVIA